MISSSISFSKEERSSLSSSSEDESLFEKEMKAWPAQRRKRKWIKIDHLCPHLLKKRLCGHDRSFISLLLLCAHWPGVILWNGGSVGPCVLSFLLDRPYGPTIGPQDYDRHCEETIVSWSSNMKWNEAGSTIVQCLSSSLDSYHLLEHSFLFLNVWSHEREKVEQLW